MRHARARLCRRARVQATRVCCMVAKGVLRCKARAWAPHAVSLAPQGCAHLRRTKSSPPTPLPRHFGPASACQARRGVAGGPRPPSRVEWLAASPFSRGRLRPARRLARRHLPASRTVWAGVDHVVVPNLVVQRARTISGSGGGAPRSSPGGGRARALRGGAAPASARARGHRAAGQHGSGHVKERGRRRCAQRAAICRHKMLKLRPYSPHYQRGKKVRVPS